MGYGSKATRKEVMFTRSGKNITTLSTGDTEHFKTLNLAKKASKNLQLSNGGIGMGSLALV